MMKHKKVFISIPMNGRPDEEVKKERDYILKTYFNEYELIDQMLPALDSRIKMLARSIAMMSEADVVCFAEGWENSPGCRIEMAVCNEYGIPILTFAKDENDNDILSNGLPNNYIINLSSFTANHIIKVLSTIPSDTIVGMGGLLNYSAINNNGDFSFDDTNWIDEYKNDSGNYFTDITI